MIENKPITELTTDEVKELQSLLIAHGYDLGDYGNGGVDGMVGEKTIEAFNDFKRKNHLGYPNILGQTTLEKLKQVPPKSETKGRIHDFSNRQGVVDAIRWECNQHNLPLKTQHAYVIATTQWETDHTFKPVREAFRLSEDWRRRNLRYYPYYGRGYVQLTWKTNYDRYSKILGVNFVNNPDLVMEPNVSLFILCHGFKHGTFTGRKLEDYVNSAKTDFINARRVINGTDKAREIAQLTQQWLNQL